MNEYLTISLYQPWATLCVMGDKIYETRSRPPIPSVIGKRVAIQASKQRVVFADIGAEALDAISKAFGIGGWDRQIPYGAVVGTVVVRGAYHIAEFDQNSMTARADRCLGDMPLGNAGGWFKVDLLGNYMPNRWAWLLEDPVAFDEPYPERGCQGWWKWREPRGAAS